MVIIWLFSEDGYISVVEYTPNKPLPKDEAAARAKLKDEEKGLGEAYRPATSKKLGSHLLVRARVKADLDPIVKLLQDQGLPATVKDQPSADYRFRLLVPRTLLAEYVASKVESIDYDSHVKETINSRAPKVPGGRMQGMMATWSATSKWQPTPPYSGKNWNRYATGGIVSGGHSYANGTLTAKAESQKKADEWLDSWKKGQKSDPKVPGPGAFDDDDLLVPGEFDFSESALDDADEAALQLRDDNEAMAALVIDRLVEDYGATDMRTLPDNAITEAFRTVLADLKED